MGCLIVESTQSQTRTVETITENCLKDKKKNRRSRRSKRNSSLSASNSASQIQIHGELSPSGGDSSLNCTGSDEHHQLSQMSNVAGFNLLLTMDVNEQTADENLQNQQALDVNGEIFSNSHPEPAVIEEPMGPVLLACPNDLQDRRKYFPPHWSTEAVTEALERGDAFKSLFRVNAHNRLEAYCKIDGVQTDVLINGLVAQNRAVEGDTVAIVIDPPSLWSKMKGFNENVNHSALVDDCSCQPEAVEYAQDSSKGKSKLDPEDDYDYSRNSSVSAEKGIYYEDVSSVGAIAHLEPTKVSENGYINGYHPSTSYSSSADYSVNVSDVVNAVEKLCALVSSFPSKRPTGRVVAVIESSLRRDTVVGFLSVKQWSYSRESNKKESRKNKHRLTALNRGYVLLTPTDPKFTKMTVPVKNLPECIKKRLDAGDATVEMDLVAARMVNWGEESYIPEAHVMHIFGRGSDVEAQIAAILFENAIDPSEFSSEALSCLPHIPWKVPVEEVQNRKDLRNLCVFTIDPANATDLDDALSVEKLSNRVSRVGVHITDASYFVLPDTALDIDAQIRSTSVYLLQSKLPMLPPLLSENLCSLSPGVDRLAFSIFWDINSAGEVLDRWIGRTIINSCCKLSYEHAQEIIDGALVTHGSISLGNDWPQLHGQFEWFDIIRSVKSLHEISKVLKENRFTRGALSLESPKVDFVFDEDGVPYDSVFSERKESNFLVEEFMLLANRTAAEVITRAYPTSALLRRHPEPNVRKLKDFETFCNKHGIKLDISSSGHLHHSLERIKQELEYDCVLLDILMSYAARPMQLAAYFCSGDFNDADGDWGHYALAVPLYTHFTSPLRRYPDIIVHRTLAATVEAEEMYWKQEMLQKLNGEEAINRCFTGISFDKDAIKSPEAQAALSAAAAKHRCPGTEILADVAAHCNERKLASRRVKDATHKLYTWNLLKKKEILFSEARVLGLGPKFMSIYILKLAIERRIYYDEVEGLKVEWLENTSTLVLSQFINKRSNRRSSPGKFRPLDEVALIADPCDLKPEMDLSEWEDKEDGESQIDSEILKSGISEIINIEPAVFPLTVRLLSTIPVALHAVGGDDGPLDIGTRLYISSYL
ncbi:Inactive exonuclease DIS3L2 [Abeliophyllum distichum]|uniref:DIS3-like exonuclease 2 n=1 Tax=Abeliophyllum distichum TaxID=126358 RepID=A0ABD1S8Z5_9LAMI